ncbi:MAG TPA: BatA domain-containing protein [Burkholderiales bacterium]|nr:BatA domain-containing protein [Burkholderiales bacterium]
MNLLSASLSGAAIAALAAALVVTALYLLKPPPRRLLVPSSLIWDRVLRESLRNSDRLRWWLSLLLALVIAVSIVVAVTRPQLTSAGEAADRLVLVLDNSPTLATRTTDGATRWTHALAKARATLAQRNAGSQVMLVDTMRRIAIPGFEYRDAALERLQRLQVTYGGTPRVPDIAQAGEAETVVISDGVQITGVPESARLESVFEPVENAGITAFEVRPLPADPRRYQAFVEVSNAGGADRDIEIGIAGVGGRRITRTVNVPSGGALAQLIDISSLDAGPVRASLTMPGDGLEADDVAYALLPMRRVVRVGLVSSGNTYLEKSLRAQARVQLTTMLPQHFAERRDIDVWVFDRFAPKTQPGAPALLFRPNPVPWLPTPGKETADVTVAAWDGAHPLLENLSLRDLIVERAVATQPANEVRDRDVVLVSARGNLPLVVAHEGTARRVSFAFGLEDSNFALHAEFPLFLGNALDWLAGERGAFAARLGVVEVPVPKARVVAPDGTELATQAVPDGTLFEVREPGMFTAVSASQRLRVAANLLDRRVTEVNRSPLSPLRLSEIEPAQARFPLDPWAALLLASTVLLILEWWTWNRRLTV